MAHGLCRCHVNSQEAQNANEVGVVSVPVQARLGFGLRVCRFVTLDAA